MICLGFTSPRARLAHQCELCNRTIDAGEVYGRWRMIGDDGPYVWKECAHCRALLALYRSEIVYDDSEGYGWDSVADWEPSTAAGVAAQVGWRMRWRTGDGHLLPLPEAA